MDIGLGKVLEMFEDRFGRRATTCLLFLLYVAIAAFCINVVKDSIALPIYGFLSQYLSSPALTVTTAFYTVSFIAVLAILYPVFSIFSRSRRVPQTVIDHLAEIRSRVIRDVLNAKVTSDKELEAWINLDDAWVSEVIIILEKNLPKSEVLGFQRLGVIREGVLGHSFNAMHAHRLMMFSKRLSILEDIIRRYSQ